MCATLTRPLPSTLTATARSYTWEGEPDRSGGTLLITQGRKSTRHTVTEDVWEAFPGRAWLVNTEDLPAEEICPSRLGTYRVECGPAGWECTCTGFGRHHHCKHTDCLRDLLERGDLDPTPLPEIQLPTLEEIEMMSEAEELTTDAPAAAEDKNRYRNDRDLPDGVLALILQGREAIAAVEEEKAAAERRKMAEARTRAELWLEPVRRMIARRVPEALLGYLAYPVDALTKLVAEFSDLASVRGGQDVIVTLTVPGCHEIRMPARRSESGGWVLIPGYEFQVKGCDPARDLPTALAHAREKYLADLAVPY